MAESVVRLLVDTLRPLVVEEVGLLKNVGKAMAEIKDEFVSMQALLREADAKEEGDHRVKAWLKEICDVVYKTEDVVDEFKLLQHDHPEQPHGSCISIMDVPQSIGHFFKTLKRRHQVAAQIEDLKNKVKEISRRKEDYSLSRWEQGSTSTPAKQYDPRDEALFVKEAQLVGINESRNKLIGWLVGSEQDLSLGVISVYGDGGVGKTTLVRKVFESQTVMTHFPFRHWVNVSQSFDIKFVLQEMIKKLSNEDEEARMQDKLKGMVATQLMEMLRDRLGQKRYVVVLDDIWKPVAWRAFKNAFPDMGNGSRIMVTTRYHDIATECSRETTYGHEFKLPHLTPDDALKLFCKKALASNLLPPHLSDISQKFLQKCKGLPLAIVSISGFLRTKDHREWGHVYDKLGYLMGPNQKLDEINSILSLSYVDLPFHLKPCFLYLSIFPDDYSIQCSRLFRLWVAEGFVRREYGIRSDATMEEIAKDYLDELINRSLVQPEDLDIIGRVKTCRVHDILREFILLKAHEQNFVAQIVEQEGGGHQVIGRHLCISNIQNFKKTKSFSHLRSFFLINPRSFSSTMFTTLCRRFKFLRVLVLDADFEEFPSAISNLLYLRYLSIVGLKNHTNLPRELGKLTNLEVFCIRSTSKVLELPKEILTLKRLRHLKVGKRDFLKKGIRLPAGIEKLTNLEKLSQVVADGEGSCDMVKGLGMLTQMRSLSIKRLKKEDGMELFASVEKMTYLHSLSLKRKRRHPLGLPDQWCPPPNIQKLLLSGRLVPPCLPPWFSKLDNLIKLKLSASVVNDGLLRDLGKLPNLAELNLSFNGINGNKVCFENGGFLKLKHLSLKELTLTTMEVEEGAMPSIEKLIFCFCLQLQKVPLGIDHLITLKTIELRHMPDNFVKEIKKQVWKDGHAPIIAQI